MRIPECVEMVLSHAEPLAAEALRPLDARGRVLAAPLVAPWPHPPFPAAIKDGFAVRSSDSHPMRLAVVASVRAGEAAPSRAIRPGEAAYITTGSPLPPGADAVVALEQATILDPSAQDAPRAADEPPPPRAHAAAAAAAAAARSVRVDCPVSAGAEVRPVGSDIGEGAELVPAGAVIGPAEVGLAAFAGGRPLSVHAQPTVAILSSGDELIDPLALPDSAGDSGAGGSPTGSGAAARIYDSNRPALLAATAAEGGVGIDFGIARDDAASLAAKLDEALLRGCDALVCTGGAVGWRARAGGHGRPGAGGRGAWVE